MWSDGGDSGKEGEEPGWARSKGIMMLETGGGVKL